MFKYSCFFFQAEDGIRDFCLSRGLGDVYKRQGGGGSAWIGRSGYALNREPSRRECRVDNVRVVAGAASHQIRAAAAVEIIVAGAAVQAVIAAVAQQAVVPNLPCQRIAGRVSLDDIVGVVA